MSPATAVRPPSLLTYSLPLTSAMPRGAMPVVQLWVIAPVAASIATTRFWPLTAPYTVEPSAEKTALPDSACAEPSAGIATSTGVASVPSGLTVNLV